MTEINPNPSIEVISFDLWQTLIAYKSRELRNARNAMLASYLDSELSLDEFDAVAHGTNKGADKLAEERGTDVMFAERIGLIAVAIGRPVPSNNLVEEMRAEQSNLIRMHPPGLLEPTTPDMLEQLRGDYTLGIVSNTGLLPASDMRGALDTLGIGEFFSHKVFSDEVGYAKPHPRIYDALVNHFGIPAEKVLHIGDNYAADYIGASSIGMQAVHLEKGVPIAEALGSVLGRNLTIGAN